VNSMIRGLCRGGGFGGWGGATMTIEKRPCFMLKKKLLKLEKGVGKWGGGDPNRKQKKNWGWLQGHPKRIPTVPRWRSRWRWGLRKAEGRGESLLKWGEVQSMAKHRQETRKFSGGLAKGERLKNQRGKVWRLGSRS